MTSYQSASTGSTRQRPVPEIKREIGQPALRARMEQLLGRYPEVTPEETQEIIAFLKKGPHLDVGLVTAEDAMRAKVQDIRTRYPAEFRLKAYQAALFVAFICGPFFYLAVKHLF